MGCGVPGMRCYCSVAGRMSWPNGRSPFKSYRPLPRGGAGFGNGIDGSVNGDRMWCVSSGPIRPGCWRCWRAAGAVVAWRSSTPPTICCPTAGVGAASPPIDCSMTRSPMWWPWIGASPGDWRSCLTCAGIGSRSSMPNPMPSRSVHSRVLGSLPMRPQNRPPPVGCSSVTAVTVRGWICCSRHGLGRGARCVWCWPDVVCHGAWAPRRGSGSSGVNCR